MIVKNYIKKMKFIVIVLLMIFASYTLFLENIQYGYLEIQNANYLTGLTKNVGTYSSSDGKAITVNEDGTILYEGAYALTEKTAASGNILTGKIGTNSKSATFYQLNPSTIVSADIVEYTISSGTAYLKDYTIFKVNSSVSADSNGSFELWRNGTKVNSYNTLQDAIDTASSGDTIKITANINVSEGTYINKNITIEGNGNTLDKSTWSNPVFVIEEGVTAKINNLTIDGGAKNFKMEISGTTPKINASSLTSDHQSNTSAIISKGNINTNKLNLNNNYTAATGAALKIISGTATLTNSSFNHNYSSTEGGAIYIGRDFHSGETTYPVTNITIDNTVFDNNYSKNGGAVSVNYTETFNAKNSTFKNNSALTNGGALQLAPRTPASIEKKALGLEYTKAYVDGCSFEQNIVGNDGYAIQNQAAHLYINNSSFTGNVGLNPTGSVGTISAMLDDNRNVFNDVFIENSTFNHNVGNANIFGDHATLVTLKMNNVTATDNKNGHAIFLRQSMSTIENVTIKNQQTDSAVISVLPTFSSSVYPHCIPPVITLKNIVIENTDGPTDILISRANHNMSNNTATVNVEGTTMADVDVWDATYLNVNGKLDGDVLIDEITSTENVVVSSDGEVTGEITKNDDTYIITVHYPTDGKDIPSVEFLYLEKNKTYTEKEIFMMLRNSKEGSTMKLYTDQKYTTAWDYTASKSMTVYGQWQDHQHTFDGTLVVDNSGIYEQCTLGHLGRGIFMVLPTNLTYDSKEKGVTITNDLEAKDYTLKYYQLINNKWTKIDNTPKKAGEYKAVLTYNNLTAEAKYTIVEELKNPVTGTNVSIFLIIIIGAITYTMIYKNLKNTNEKRI